MNNTCPLTGNQCNNPPVFAITEQLGDKSQSTTCCRHCVEQFVHARNASAAPRNTASEFVDRVLRFAAAPVKTCQCGWTMSHIVNYARTNCPACTVTFREELRSFTTTNEQAAIQSPPQDADELRRAMDKAVENEDYVEAARCRDLLKKIQGRVKD